VEVPTRLDSKQKKMLKDFGESCKDENHPMSGKLRDQANGFFKAKQEIAKTKDSKSG
jgi:hypothetical protein